MAWHGICCSCPCLLLFHVPHSRVQPQPPRSATYQVEEVAARAAFSEACQAIQGARAARDEMLNRMMTLLFQPMGFSFSLLPSADGHKQRTVKPHQTEHTQFQSAMGEREEQQQQHKAIFQ